MGDLDSCLHVRVLGAVRVLSWHFSLNTVLLTKLRQYYG
jgi:hypothetical protein